jgi:hypothetical protein
LLLIVVATELADLDTDEAVLADPGEIPGGDRNPDPGEAATVDPALVPGDNAAIFCLNTSRRAIGWFGFAIANWARCSRFVGCTAWRYAYC